MNYEKSWGVFQDDGSHVTTRKRWQEKLGYYSLFAAAPALIGSTSGEARSNNPVSPLEDAAAVVASGPDVSSRRRARRPDFLRRSGHLLDYQKGGSGIVAPASGSEDCPGQPITGGSFTSGAPFIDYGTTVKANDTVTALCLGPYCYEYTPAEGHDRVYSFKLTSRGESSQIRVSANAPNYKPLVYIVDSRFDSTCPAGFGNYLQAWQILIRSTAPAHGGSVTIGSDSMSVLPLNTPLYLFVDSESVAFGESGPYTLRIQDVQIDGPAATVVPTAFDFDGDARADVSVFRPTDSTWYIDRSTNGFTSAQFGISSDTIAPADFDGDRKTDLAIYRDGVWWSIDSSTNAVKAHQFGLPGDIPVPADFDADGRTEMAVYRNGVWWSLNLATQEVGIVSFGNATDKPVVADYDGDGRADQAVYRNGVWHINYSLLGYRLFNFGYETDRPVVSDYDGDRRADPAVYRDGEWHIARSANGYAVLNFGISTDTPVPADYDGDGRTDLAVFRDGVWYLLRSTSGFGVAYFGLPGDKAIPSAYRPL